MCVSLLEHAPVVMTTAVSIFILSLLGSALASAGALGCARVARGGWIGALVGFAVGALLGVAFLEILPQLLRSAARAPGAIGAMLFGILGFFVLEKLFVWRHHHGGQWVSEHDAHEVNAQPRGAALMLLGNGVHNLFDGFFIAATYLAAPRLGILSALAIFAHAFAQQLGDACQRSGAVDGHRENRKHAVAACVATLAGALLAYALFARWPDGLNFALGGAAASMIYVAMADLIPSLHTRTDSAAAMQQVVLIGLGVAVVALLGTVLS
jgi:zinc and cadmium transporter